MFDLMTRGASFSARSFFLAALSLFSWMCVAGAVHAQTPPGFGDPGARTSGGSAATGDFVAVDPTLNIGNITIGATSQVVVLFRNDSGRPIQTGEIQLYPSSTVSAEVSMNQCSAEEQPAAAVCAISLAVRGLQTGTFRVDMLMQHNGRARLVTTSITGQVQAGDTAETRFISDVEAIPSEIDFGNLQDVQSVVRSVVLRNTTSQPIDINSIYIESPERAGYSIRTDCKRLVPGQVCIMTVTWSPVLRGNASGVLIIEHSGPTTLANVNLRGDFSPAGTRQAEIFPEAVPGKGLLVASQEEVNFGSGVESVSSMTVSLVNVGDAPLTLREIKLGSTESAGVSISRNGCRVNLVLDPVEACPLTLSWSPVRVGQLLDDIQILHSGARGVLVMPVRGQASSAVSQDTKAVRLTGVRGTGVISDDAAIDLEPFTLVSDEGFDPSSLLGGYVVTSHSPTRAIISGPGGSRIVFNGEEIVLGGVLWNVDIRSSGIEFSAGSEKVLLLFDRSLSSTDRSSSSSSSSGMAAN